MFAHTHTHTHTHGCELARESSMIIFISLKSMVHSKPGHVDTLLARRVVEKDHHQMSVAISGEL